jgi:hypothetical protein
MAAAHQSLRRRAAWAVLAPVMDEDALIEALWLQHDTLRGDSVSDIIAFVDAVASRHLLDAATRKRLYAAYFDALRQPEDNLPIDPWPLMLLARPSAAPVAAPRLLGGSPPSPGGAATGWAGAAPAASAYPAYPTAYPTAFPVAPGYPGLPRATGAAAGPLGTTASPAETAAPSPTGPIPAGPPPVPAPVPLAATPAPPAPAAPAAAVAPHQAVFAALVEGMVVGLRSFQAAALSEWAADGRARLDRLRLPAALRQAVRDALAAPEAAQWQFDGTVEQLSSLVHELYVALCEAVGPVGADQVLVQAVHRAEQRPEARQVPPSRFL